MWEAEAETSGILALSGLITREEETVLFQFYIWYRWVRLTVRQHGVVRLITGTRTAHCACGRACRQNFWGCAHGWSTGRNLRAMDLVRSLQLERA